MPRKNLDETTYIRKGKVFVVDFTPLPPPQPKPKPVDDTMRESLQSALRGLIEGLFIGRHDQGPIYKIMRDEGLSRADKIAYAIESMIGPINLTFRDAGSIVTAAIRMKGKDKKKPRKPIELKPC